MDINITERGNNAFHNEEGATVLFAEIGDNKYLQAAYTPMNYPAWVISTVTFMDDELRNHIMYNLADWFIDKCQVKINLETNGYLPNGYVIGAEYVISEVVEHVVKMAEKNDYNPNNTDGALYDAILDSSILLEYDLTARMHQECYEELFDIFDNYDVFDKGE